VALALLGTATATGCGTNERAGAVQVTVTARFGSVPRGQSEIEELPGSATAQQLLTTATGATVGPTWFAFVNGIEAPPGSDDAKVRPGDRVWLDRHDPGPAKSIPAVVGSFPEPFRSGIAGRRLPVRIECEETGGAACAEARARLAQAGIAAGSAVLGGSSAGRIIRVLVGRWPALRRTPEVQLIEDGPARSGVFARMDRSGDTLTVLDPQGGAAETLGAGAGLVAATRGETLEGEEGATWIVTGTDDRGVLAASKALEEGVLGNRFALAIAPDGVGVPLPKVR
jgi:hypothetical protein